MEIWEMTALALGQQIRAGKISSEEAVKACLERAKQVETDVHAFVHLDGERAIQAAREADRGIREGRYDSPLAGVPVAVKDNLCTEGMPTTCCSRILEQFVPPYTAEAVKRLTDAGAVILGKTNMDEFAMGSTTETSCFGPTKNPWDVSRAPGGSSGGSCSAVAAGECAAALGSDTGGSIRQPASWCGVTGIKPTYGAVSRYGLIAYGSSLDQVGPIGRDTADCAALLGLLVGRDPKDATSAVPGAHQSMDSFLKYAPTSSETGEAGGEVAARGLRVGIPGAFLGEGTEPGVQAAIREAAERLKAMGATVEPCSLGLEEYVIPAYYVIASAEASSNLERFDGVKYGFRADQEESDLHGMYKRSRSQGFGPEVKRRILLGTFVLSAGYYDAYYLKALKVRALVRQAFDRVFERYDVLLAPAAPSTAVPLGESLADPLKMYLGDIDTVAVNLAGLPGLSLPWGLDGQGLPVGLQLMGNRFREDLVFRAAFACEAARGPWKEVWKREGGISDGKTV